MTLDRLKPVQGFQGAQGAAAMLVSLKAAGTGITLHAADYVFLLDPWWNPAVEAQSGRSRPSHRADQLRFLSIAW